MTPVTREAVGRRAHLLVAALAVLLVAIPLRAQPTLDPVRLELGSAGPGAAGRLLTDVLRAGYLAVQPGVATLGLPRDTTFDRTIIVVGSDVTVASTVRGDVVVVGGDLFLRPGAAIQGRAIAFGGGVYQTLLGRADGGAFAFRDETFAVTRTGDLLVLEHQSLVARRSGVFSVPGIYGLRAPAYTRSDGLVLPVAPLVSIAGGRVEVEPHLTYRSHLGAVDPGLVATIRPELATRIEATVERGTYTNDAWMRGDWVNSAAVLALGEDLRNYFRAWRASALVHRRWDTQAMTLEPRVGARTEEGWSTGPLPGTSTAPWSAFGRRDTTRMLRPNPEVVPGRLSSALAGARADLAGGGIVAVVDLQAELAFDSPLGEAFQQGIVHASVGFATFGRHRLESELRAVHTTGGTAPPQRYHYLGGGGTLRTLETLEMGGDRLFYLESRYLIPLSRPAIPFLGPPTIGVAYAVGAAGVERLPPLVQNVGLQLLLNLLRLEVMVDPATGERSAGAGVSLGR